MKQFTCRKCGKIIDAIPEQYGLTWIMRSKNYYYHTECYKNFIDKTVEKTEPEWFDLIFSIFVKDLHVSYNFFQIKAQAEKMVKEGYTMKGIYYTLYWHYVINKNPYDPKYGIGIVPCIYKNSIIYWTEEKRKQDDILEQIQKQEEAKIIYVKPKKRKKKIISPPNI